MPTDAIRAVALFLFAHQDDEFGVLQRIAHYRARGVRVACAYLTDGNTASADSARRNAESRAVLGRLGVDPADIAFAGEELGIGDARLPLHLVQADAWIGRWLDRHIAIEALHVTAWEGGHHDHDALHALAVHQAGQRGLLARTWQYSLYQAEGLPGPLFRVQAPLAANGPVDRIAIPWGDRLRNLRCCLSYPSQLVTWIGLFPPVAWRTLVGGVEMLQPVSAARVLERPHAGALYYEKRKFFTWERMQDALERWRTGLPPA